MFKGIIPATGEGYPAAHEYKTGTYSSSFFSDIFRFNMSRSSTSKTSVAPPGIVGGEPRSPEMGIWIDRNVIEQHIPYPRLLGIRSFRFSPMHILSKVY